MHPPEATGRIKIKSIPSGDPPEEVRKAWVGLTLPCYPVAGYTQGAEIGALTERLRKEKRDTVIVPQAEALAILEEHAPDAAKWWREHGFPRRFAPNFSFGLDEVEIISGVRLQKHIEVTDEMMGDPGR